jgi:hypothetical protein
MNHKRKPIIGAPFIDRLSKPKSFVPRLLNKAQAAAYCGMSIGSFSANCDVVPIRVQPGLRGLRYDIEDLAEWIERKKTGPQMIHPDDLIEELGCDKN